MAQRLRNGDLACVTGRDPKRLAVAVEANPSPGVAVRGVPLNVGDEQAVTLLSTELAERRVGVDIVFSSYYARVKSAGRSRCGDPPLRRYQQLRHDKRAPGLRTRRAEGRPADCRRQQRRDASRTHASSPRSRRRIRIA
jgi:hypothetical protein